MKRLLLLALLLVIFVSCSNNDDVRNDNPNLIDPLVDLTLNLSLPQYQSLNFPGGSVIINTQGIKGIVVYNVNNDLYTAFELSDPNHTPSSCSRMEVEAPIATCPCSNDENEYNIITGEHQTDPSLFPMQQYRITRTNDVIRITN
jgi:nitrite reductase/ring-hydroxylating ferredoxin subunit